MAGHVGKFLQAEEELKDQVRKKKSSTLTAITGGSEGDWECFQQLEKIQHQRRELESWCRLYAPSGTWDRWQAYQAEARKARAAAKKQREKERQEMIENLSMIGGAVLAIVVIVGAIYAIGKYLGKW